MSREYINIAFIPCNANCVGKAEEKVQYIINNCNKECNIYFNMDYDKPLLERLYNSCLIDEKSYHVIIEGPLDASDDICIRFYENMETPKNIKINELINIINNA